MIAPAKKIEAWHFSEATCLCRYDARKIVPGETLTTAGELVLCANGLHASKNILDALTYAPGPYVWRVELSGKIIEGTDKLVARKRKALWGYDATNILHTFACKCALDVIHLWDAPAVVKQYLETGDESLRAAAGAAGAAGYTAGATAWDAARDAARDAAGAAAWAAGAAGYTAGATAWDAARDAAGAAAWAAGYTAGAAGYTAGAAGYTAGAAGYAAGYAAGATAWAAQSSALETMIMEESPCVTTKA